MQDYETMKFSQLYVGEMNRSSHFNGEFRLTRSHYDRKTPSSDGDLEYYTNVISTRTAR